MCAQTMAGSSRQSPDTGAGRNGTETWPVLGSDLFSAHDIHQCTDMAFCSQTTPPVTIGDEATPGMARPLIFKSLNRADDFVSNKLWIEDETIKGCQ